MPHSNSAKKRLRQNFKLRQLNRARKSAMKTAMKKVFTAVESKDLDQASKDLPAAMRLIDKAAKSHTIHANTASRRKARVSLAVAGLRRELETTNA